MKPPKLNPILTTAQPGWSVVLWSIKTGKIRFAPIVAWGTVGTEPVAIWVEVEAYSLQLHWAVDAEDTALGYCAPGDESNHRWSKEARIALIEDELARRKAADAAR